MSEIINNRQQRIAIIKNLFQQLHQGSSENQIRNQLETMLDEGDYSDVFQMEVQLIEEGISEEKIRDLCHTHTRVLAGHLDLQETPSTNPGHPVHTFIQENRALTLIIQAVRLLIQQIAGMGSHQDALEPIREIQSLLTELMDVDKHYHRKENLLFSLLREERGSRTPGGDVGQTR